MNSKHSLHLVGLALALLHASLLQAAEPSTIKDIEYATIAGEPMKLDLYLPAAKHPPLIVWVHGGAWRAGSRSDMPLGKFIQQGYAVASVDYRLSTVARFPAMIHDIKAAIRYLRAKADEHGYDSNRFIIAGGSAGGHLAALVGVTNGHKELEGKEGKDLDQKSDVQAIMSFYGGSNLMSILGQSTAHGLKVRVPALDLLLDGQPEQKPDLAKLASPVFHVDAHDPPLLLIHGDADPQMPPEQSRELAAAYQKAGLTVQLEMIPGAVHGGKEFFDEKRFALALEFLKRHLPHP